MGAYFSEIVQGLWSLFVGLGITFKEFFKPVVTVPYPYETLKVPARYRGHVELIEDEEGKPKCIVCMACQRACPSDCTRCSLCGSCVEACNFDALTFSKEYNLASTRKEDFIFDLLKRLEDRNS